MTDAELVGLVSQLMGNGGLYAVLLYLLVDERRQLKEAREAHISDLRKAINNKADTDSDK